LLIDVGILEAAIADALCEDIDELHPTLVAARAACDAAGALLVDGGNRAPLVAALERLLDEDLPPDLIERAPEGYSQYGLFPESFIAPALRVLAPRVVVIGLRSIGTSLASMVSAVLRAAGAEVRSFTVRPRGRPWERELRIGPRLAAQLLAPARHLVVDEGPGLSGSSLAACVTWLEAHGAGDVVLLPSADRDAASLLSPKAQSVWRSHRREVASFDPTPLVGAGGAEDLSAGRWRRRLGVWPPIHPWHERQKFSDGCRWWKFAGFSRWGAARRLRAQRLAEARFAPPGAELRHGFLVRQFVAGTPRTRVDRPFVERIAEYLVFRRTFVTDETPEPLEPMARENLGALAGKLDRCPKFAPGPTVVPDARLLLHEWVGDLACDAVDHGDDHFYPGPCDAAWDVAAACIEFGGAEILLPRYRCVDPDIDRRLPFYRLAYLAQRLGYCQLAAQTLEGDERARFIAEAARYQQLAEAE
jgi:hypothetical protein